MTDNDAGERQSWVRELVRQHQSPLIRYARSIVRDEHAARDVVQETFLQLCRQSPADLTGHETAWLFRVCHNTALNRIRKDGRMRHNTETLDSAGVDDDASTKAEASEDTQVVLKLIDTLPDNQQKVVRLRFHSGLAYREISEATGLTIGNVGYLLHTALGRLREEIQGMDA